MTNIKIIIGLALFIAVVIISIAIFKWKKNNSEIESDKLIVSNPPIDPIASNDPDDPDISEVPVVPEISEVPVVPEISKVPVVPEISGDSIIVSNMIPVNDNQFKMDVWCNALGKSRKVKFDGTEDNKLVYRFGTGVGESENAHRCYRKSALDYSKETNGCYNKEGDLVKCYGVHNGISLHYWSNADWTKAIKNRIRKQTGKAPKFGI